MAKGTSLPAGRLQLYFARNLPLNAIEKTATLASFSDSQSNRLQKIKNQRRREEFLTSRHFMRAALDQLLGDDGAPWNFEEAAHTAPNITNLPANIQISLSHSKELICFALANHRLGVDIEVNNPNRRFAAMTHLFMTQAEQTEFARDPKQASDYFYRCWCIKEAYYKAQTKRQQQQLRFTQIPIAGFDGWRLREGQISNHSVAIAHQGALMPIDCHYLPTQTGWDQPFQLSSQT